MHRYNANYDGFGGVNAPLPPVKVDWSTVDLDYQVADPPIQIREEVKNVSNYTVPPFCTMCLGHGSLVRHTANATRMQVEVPRSGSPWTGTVDRSKAARIQAIEPVQCPRCKGTGHEKAL